VCERSEPRAKRDSNTINTSCDWRAVNEARQHHHTYTIVTSELRRDKNRNTNTPSILVTSSLRSRLAWLTARFAHGSLRSRAHLGVHFGPVHGCGPLLQQQVELVLRIVGVLLAQCDGSRGLCRQSSDLFPIQEISLALNDNPRNLSLSLRRAKRSEAKRGAFSTKHESSERAKTVE